MARRRRSKGRPAAWTEEKIRAVLTPAMRVVASAVVLVCLGSVTRHFVHAAEADARFLVDPSSLVDEGVPDWVPASVVESLRARLRELPPISLFDSDFTERVRNEVSAASPWIADVSRVEKLYPNRARLDLVLRKPVASVDLDGRRYLLDGEARVIHVESSFQPSAFPFVVFPVLGAAPRHRPVLGRTFPDHEVQNAVEVALEMHSLSPPFRQALMLSRPEALEVRREAGGVHPGEVTVRSALGDVVIRWGRPKRFWDADGTVRDWSLVEPPAEKKVTHLAQLLEAFPGLDGVVEARLDFDRPWYRTRRSPAVQFLESDWVDPPPSDS